MWRYSARYRSLIEGLAPGELGLERAGMLLVGNASRPVTRRKVWGERASGTNFLNALIDRNFPDLADSGRIYWKHGYAPLVRPRQDRLNLLILRDPFDWLRSFKRIPWHAPRRFWDEPFSAFIRREWIGLLYDQGTLPVERLAERHPLSRRRFADVLELRQVKMRHHLIAAAHLPNSAVVRFEDVSADPQGFVRDLAQTFGLARNEEFRPVNDYKGVGTQAFVPRDYAPIDEADRRHILSRLDPRLEGFFGYLPETLDTGSTAPSECRKAAQAARS